MASPEAETSARPSPGSRWQRASRSSWLSPEASEEELREAGMAQPVPPFVDYFREPSSEDTTLAVRTDAVEEVTGRRPRSLRQFAADHAEAFRSG